ncbi:MAG TPA: hypothetical protein VMS55_12445 [Myxococcota bacterium]|nr:hypothetical protein [Myxococcota bacterium]
MLRGALGDLARDRCGARRVADEQRGVREREAEIGTVAEARDRLLESPDRARSLARADPQLRLLEPRLGRIALRALERLDRFDRRPAIAARQRRLRARARILFGGRTGDEAQEQEHERPRGHRRSLPEAAGADRDAAVDPHATPRTIARA